MRWSYVVPRLLFVAILWAGLRFGLDPLLRYSAVRTLQATIGARADIEAVETQLFPPAMKVSHVALANAGRAGTNLVSFDEMSLQLAGKPLLRRQFVVNRATLTGVRLRSPRADDGLLDETEDLADDDTEPSWITEKLRGMSHEWLQELETQAKAELDPDVLETYRTGTEIYDRWHGRFQELSHRAGALRPQALAVRQRFDEARRADPLQQISQYVQVAQDAENLMAEASAFRDELTGITPQVREDLGRLDQARRHDQQMIRNRIELLRPDPRRMAESVIGEPMYRQLMEAITWIEAARDYYGQLHGQAKPARRRGTDFDFPVSDPTPGFLIRELVVSGELELGDGPIPFEAVINDITSDAPLLHRPCIIRLKTTNRSPLQLRVIHDATAAQHSTQITASYQHQQSQAIAAGHGDNAAIQGVLSGMQWHSDMTIIDNNVAGRLSMSCRLDDVAVHLADSVRPEFSAAANQALADIHTVHADLLLHGPLLHPELDLQTDLGDQISSGLQTAVTAQIGQARERLMAEIDAYAASQLDRLRSRFAAEYQQLVADHEETVRQIRDVQQIVATLQSGQADPATLFRQVSESSLLKDKDRAKMNRVLENMDQKMQLPTRPGQPSVPRLPGLIPGLRPSPPAEQH